MVENSFDHFWTYCKNLSYFREMSQVPYNFDKNCLLDISLFNSKVKFLFTYVNRELNFLCFVKLFQDRFWISKNWD